VYLGEETWVHTFKMLGIQPFFFQRGAEDGWMDLLSLCLGYTTYGSNTRLLFFVLFLFGDLSGM
jgi:hypothetical protein